MIRSSHIPRHPFVIGVLGALLAGCAAEPADEETGARGGEIRDANGNEVVTASIDTTLKTSTADSRELPSNAKCAVTKGAKVTLSAVSVVGRHVRGKVAAAVGACADKAAFAVGREVFVFRDHFTGWAPLAAPQNPSSLPTCSPERARGVVAPHPKALLDTIAVAEGTRGRGQDGFNVIFTYKYFSDCGRHPRSLQCSGGLCSDAAGRYQFLSMTWSRLGLPTFNPENQERGALKLVSGRGVSLPAGRALTATEFNNAMDRLSYEWASLPPGRYGQPMHSYAALRRTYCGLAGC